MSFIPSPSANGFHLGPLFIHAYGLAYVVAVTAAVIITRRRWEARRRQPRPRLRRRAVGLPGRASSAGACTSSRRAGTRCRRTGGARSRSGRAAWASGAGSRSASLVGLWRVRRAGASMPAVHGRRRARRCWSRRRSGGSATTSTRSSSAARARCRGRCRSTPAHRPARLPAVRHLRADVPLRADLEPRCSRRSSSGSGDRARIRPPGLFALYVAGYSGFRIFEETQRIDPSHYLFGLRINLYVAALLTLIGAAWFRLHPAAARPARGGRRAADRRDALAAPGARVRARNLRRNA